LIDIGVHEDDPDAADHGEGDAAAPVRSFAGHYRARTRSRARIRLRAHLISRDKPSGERRPNVCRTNGSTVLRRSPSRDITPTNNSRGPVHTVWYKQPSIIEKREGIPEPASTEQLEEHGRDTLAVVEEAFADSGIIVETELRYGTDLIATVFETAEDHDVECIAFIPRPKGRLVALLSGDPGWKLVNRTKHPILVLPRPPESETGA
jgi:hypothetical protein